MAYQAEISRHNPAAFLFLIDQSGSMSDKLPGGGIKADRVADVMNRTLMNLITRCTKSEGTRDYFDIGVIGYGGRGVNNGFQGSLGNTIMHPISAIESAPLRIEERVKREDDGAGGLIERHIKFPVWFESEAFGGTPMREALIRAAEELANWCDEHPESYPPTILHITDGEANDGDPEEIAEKMKELGTNDGQMLIYNMHVSDSNPNPIIFPSSENGLPDRYAQMLFRMSSVLPEFLQGCAQEKGIPTDHGARGFIYNADGAQIVDFFDIGTRAAQMR